MDQHVLGLSLGDFTGNPREQNERMAISGIRLIDQWSRCILGSQEKGPHQWHALSRAPGANPPVKWSSMGGHGKTSGLLGVPVGSFSPLFWGEGSPIKKDYEKDWLPLF